MFDYIRGRVVSKGATGIVLDNDGIGYRINMTMRAFQELNSDADEVQIYIHYHHREDDVSLYGFTTAFERDLFELLLGVSGIGPKLGMKILTESSAESFYRIIEREDLSALSRIKGLGPKTAAKLLLEMKSRISRLNPGAIDSAENSGSSDDVRNNTHEALKNLGYKDGEIKKVLDEVFSKDPDISLEEAIRQTLAVISR